LYDVPKGEKKAERPDKLDKSSVRKDGFETQKQVGFLTTYFCNVMLF